MNESVNMPETRKIFLSVNDSPTMNSELNFTLHEGTKVQILETLDNWRKIKIADGKIGWMDVRDLKEL